MSPDVDLKKLKDIRMEVYESAALRHYSAARTLKDSGDLDNSGHLIGFAAECAIKHKIGTFPSGSDAPHGHFPDIQNIARKHLVQRSRYSTSMLALLKNEIMVGWLVGRRYYATGTTTQAELDSWFFDAGRVLASAGLKVHTA